MCCLLLCSREVLEMLELLEVMCCVLLRMPEAMEGRLSLPEMLEVLEVMFCVLLCILEAVEGGLSLLKVLLCWR
jgi:hypothetical protein